MKAYSPKEYWTGVAENPCADDPSGLAPVLYPDSPPWFNQLIDDLQFRAIRRVITLAGLSADTRILDVGCGTGRWVRRYQQFGFRAMGIDATAAMLHLARDRGTAAALTVGEAYRLPFRDATFDAVSDITVTQHIPASLQLPALAEMIRVIRPGGCLILMELVQGKDRHIFPRTPEGWIEAASSCGVKLMGWFGQEFLLLDRLFVRAARILAARNGSSSSQSRSFSVLVLAFGNRSPHLLGAPAHYGSDCSMGRSRDRDDLSCPFRYSWRFRFPKVIVRESIPHTKRIIGLFPELLGIGGIQEAGRLTAAALDEIAFQRGWSVEFLSLNDPLGPHELEAGQRTIRFRASGAGKSVFSSPELEPDARLQGGARASFSPAIPISPLCPAGRSE